MMKFILALLLLSSMAQADTAGTTIRLKHSTTNLSTTVPTLLFGTIVRAGHRLEVENSTLSGTIVLVTGCTSLNNTQRNVMFLNPGFSKSTPLSVARGDCLMVYSTDAAVTTGNSAFTLYTDE